MNSPEEILKKYWGYDSFRSRQKEIIESVLTSHDTLALLPTGGGKSICFQVPGLMIEGICLVVSPLIALMSDQVDQLKKRGILAVALYSGMPTREIDIVLDNCIYGRTKFLYVSPERLSSDLFLARLEKMKVGLLAIDEAHCISQWGYDFRPSYLDIKSIYPLIPDAAKIALTATATRQVKEDICEKLEFDEPAIFQKSFARENLSYSVFSLENKYDKLLEILGNVPGSSVVYVRSRVETENVARLLYQNGVSCDFYHGGLDNKSRHKKQQEWIDNKRRVMVATNAFGMGIDKSDVRTVIHLDLPDSLEAYYQEAGRAGRDEKKAFAVLIYSPADINKLQRNLKLSNPSLDLIKRVYQALANYYKLAVGSSQWQSFDFEVKSFCHQYNLNPAETHHAIKKLQEMGLILLNEAMGKYSQLKFSISQDEIYKFCISNPAHEGVIKAMLRLYGGGLYTDLMNISEFEVARLSKSSQSEVKKKLQYLSELDVVVYDPMKTKPQMTFILPRQEITALKRYYDPLKDRHQTTENKINAMLQYAEQNQLCRTRVLQEYFDEEAYIDCGVCDLCIKKKKEAKLVTTIEENAGEILRTLEAGPVSLFDLKKEVSISDSGEFNNVIRWLLDNEKIELINQDTVKKK